MSKSESSFLNDIQEVNLSYLMLAQRLLQEDLHVGIYRLGIDEDVAETILNLSPAQIVRLAGSSNLLCSFRLNDYNLLQALSQDILGGVLQEAHTTILLTQRATAGLPAGETES